MTQKEIEQAAWNGVDIQPQLSEFIEYVYYVGLRNIYESYHSGLTERETAMQQKKQLQQLYSRFDISRRIYREHQAIESALGGYRKGLETCGCEHCKKLLRLIDGREIPNLIGDDENE